MSRKKCIFVLGMHRSGTSALTGALNLLGADLGVNMMKSQADNEKGFFENNSIYLVNERILASLGSSWDSLFPLPENWRQEGFIRTYKNELKEIIRNEFSGPLMAIKDPRLCKLLPLWIEVFQNLDIDYCAIIPVRNPLEVAKSLKKRNSFSNEKSALLWATHTFDAEYFSRECPRVFLSFDDLLRDPQKTITNFASVLELVFPKELAGSLADIKGFLEPSLKHFNFAPESIDQDLLHDIFEWYRLLSGLTSKRTIEREELLAIDALRNRFLGIYKYFYNTDVIQEFKEKGRLLGEANQKIVEKDQWLAEKERENQLLDQLLIEKERQIQARDQLLVEKERQIQARDQLLVEKERQIQARDQLLVEKDRIIAARDQEIAIFLNSTSWRITAPFRKLMAFLRDSPFGRIGKWLIKKVLLLMLAILKLFWRFIRWMRLDWLFFPHGSKRRDFFKALSLLIQNPPFARQQLKKYGISGNIKRILGRPPRQLKAEITTELNNFLFEQSKNPSNYSYTHYLYQDSEDLAVPVPEKPLVSIIIPVFNQYFCTMSCIKSVIINTKDIPYEVILVDDRSTDETKEIENKVKNLRVLRNKTNQGFLLNCNNAAREAKGEYLLFLNNDTIVLENWLKSMLDLMANDPAIGLVGPKYLYENGLLQEAGMILFKNGLCWTCGRYDPPDLYCYNYVKEVDYLSGACILIRRDLWEKLEGFDPVYCPAYYEDSDLCFRIRKAGYKVVYQPSAVVYHLEGKSYGDTRQEKAGLMARNKAIFMDRWGNELAKHFDHPSLADITIETIFLGKDRSRFKKSVLVIDWQVPRFDQNAGARCTYQYLLLMKDLGLNVKFIPADCQRSEPYTTILQQKGIEVIFEKDIRSWLQDYLPFFDFVYMHRPDISSGYIESIKKYKRADTKIIYFAHDMHHLRLMREYGITRKRILISQANDFKEKEFKMIREADIIHVVGDFEQRYIQDLFPGKAVQNIPLFIFDSPDQTLAQNSPREHLLFVGGFSHPPNKDALIWLAEKMMPDINRYLPDMKLYVVGSNPDEEVFRLASENISIVGYVSDSELRRYYEQCRILVIPLRYGAGVKGKILEGMFYGIPVVTTNIGAEGIPDAARALTIGNTEAEMVDSIVSLYNNGLLREEKIMAGREVIQRYFSKGAASTIIKRDFELRS